MLLRISACRCTGCQRPLETSSLTEHAGHLFCRNCYAKSFGPKGVGFGAATMSSESGRALAGCQLGGERQRQLSNEENNVERGGAGAAQPLGAAPALRSTFSTLQPSSVANG